MNYIPHHAVATASKFRVVFARSAKFCGISLNDRLLIEPALTCNLLNVLLRCRESTIAVAADIKAIFFQVFVYRRDQDAVRFLWHPNHHSSAQPVDFGMLTHVFGAKSSPCCAAYALRATATDNLMGASEEVVRAVFETVYVDDICCSCKFVDAAKSLISQ